MRPRNFFEPAPEGESFEAKLDRTSFDARGEADYGPDLWFDKRDEFRKGKPESTEPIVDWTAIGARLERLGWTVELVLLLKAEVRGVSRTNMARHLGWSTSEVERVWRAKNRMLGQPGMCEKIRAALYNG